MQMTLRDGAAARGIRLTRHIADVLADGERCAAVLKALSRTVTARVSRVGRSIIGHFAAQVATGKGKMERAVPFREGMRHHAGRPDYLHEVVLEPPPRARPAAECGLGLEHPPSPLRPVHSDGRLAREVASWHLERLGPLPPHAVVCPERAAARVAAWRKAQARSQLSPPPIALLRGIVHTTYLPTCVASSGDHYWMIARGRWATPLELLALFEVPAASPLGRSVATRPNAEAKHIASAIGRAIHAGDAARVLARLRSRASFPPVVRYATACSGIDTFAAAMDVAFGTTGWRYVAASESDAASAKLLAMTYSDRGLTPGAITRDARDAEAAAAAPPSDVWVFTPPCNAFSRRNHRRSERQLLEAAASIDAMLAYPRAQSPSAIVVENVDEADARSLVSSRLLSLPGYKWEYTRLEARDSGPMARARCFWMGGAPIDAPQYLAGAAVASARRAAPPPRHAPLAAAPHPAGPQRAHAILDSPATTCGALLPNTLSLRACRLAKQVRRRGTHGQTSLSRQDPSAVCDRTFESAVRRV